MFASDEVLASMFVTEKYDDDEMGDSHPVPEALSLAAALKKKKNKKPPPKKIGQRAPAKVGERPLILQCVRLLHLL